jgi:tetratricopeptide (TPR) repeat protein
VLERLPPAPSPISSWAWLEQELAERDFAGALGRLEVTTGDWIEFEGVAVPVALLRGRILLRTGAPAEARSALEAARATLAQEVQRRPGDAAVRSALGIAHAALGDARPALDEARRAVELLPPEQDALVGPWRLRDLALVHALVGDRARAIDLLDRLLSMPGWISVASIRLDPDWDSLREDPRYASLLAAHSDH